MPLYSPTGEYNKTEIFKMAASRFVKVLIKNISEIKINSVPKNTLLVIIGEYRGSVIIIGAR
jgi:hypothetical protein